MADMAIALRARLIADAAVSAVVGTRIYWSMVPAAAAMPYVRLQTVSDPRPANLDGYDSARETRVQCDCFAQSYMVSRSLAANIIAALDGPATVEGVTFGRIKAEGPRDLGEDVTGVGFVFRASVDLLVWHRS